MKMAYLLHLTLAILLLATATRGDYSSDEIALLAAIRANTSVDVRPIQNTVVKSTILLFALNDVNIGSETMSLSGVLVVFWNDPRLTWDPASAGGIQRMVVNTKYIWKPPLVIENDINSAVVLGSDGTPLRVYSNGEVLWSPPISTTSSCSADITYYPYDKQTCSLTLVGWSYTTDEVDLLTDPNSPFDMKYFTNNGEWQMLGTGYEYTNVTQGFMTFRKLVFKVTVRRQWQFYGLNIMLPLILNSILMMVVFALPIESGEKMGYCLTVLLSYIVLLTMIATNLPPISSQTSIIQVYLSVVMCVGTAGTLCTIVVLRLYHQDEAKPVPAWLQKVTQSFLSPLACITCTSNRVVSPLGKDLPEGTEEKTSPQCGYSAKEIAHILDKVLFRIFGIFMSVTTIAFVFILMTHYI
ncbi:neuronal acetylcholine receptor subunit alpha-10-like [Haliotis rufescens]|uniref:neuronal acetylcholine receptor subunit alpha-10-like n=1 Tax=Haliotis rufescens TaxID=6454 RepID=UPI00201EDD7F|nr:neuronal acetylcholine receptor subunit alpha-10-like [Haliotis rufescens]